MDYYHRSRTQLGLEKDTPEPRPIQSADMGRVIAMPEVGGLEILARSKELLPDAEVILVTGHGTIESAV